MGRHQLGLDIGGTFTDVVLVDGAGGRLWTAKTPSTPADPSDGFFRGIEKILASADAAPADVATVFHGSTIATNAVLEGKGAKTGMIVTAGFKYVLEIGRHEIPRRENLFAWVKPKRPVPPRRIMEVSERVRLDGTIERPLDEEACRLAARRLKALGVEAVAIVFLHSYTYPQHEQRAAAIVREEFPQAEISISSDVLPVFREYERSMATVLNAYVQRKVGTYVERLESGLAARGIAAPLLMMKSNGGVFGPEQASRQAINMALSGPAAGVIGASFVATMAGYAHAITIDIGGTSADVSLIRDGAAQITTESDIGPFPLALPIVDIHTVGAGGGSIARISEAGSLLVGPASAGADPGPAAYGKGGTMPTVTDANLVLGRVPPHLLGGEMPLHLDLAEAAIAREVADPLGLSVLDAADGIVRIINANMVGALKVVSVEKGYDPAAFTLVAFGGAGPLHAGDLARALGCRTVLVPRHPGLLCAVGLLATDLTYDYARTAVQRAPDYDLAAMEAIWRELEQAATADLLREGIAPERRRLIRRADLRYAKQGFELTLDVPPGPADGAGLAQLIADFHALHERLYTFADQASGVEIVTLRVRAVGLVDKIVLPEIAAASAGAPARPSGRRRTFFDGLGVADVPVYQREALKAGERVTGPAIVDQLDATTVIHPGQEAEIDRYGNIVVRVDV